MGLDRGGAALLLVLMTFHFFPGNRAAPGGPGRAAAGPGSGCRIRAPPAAPHPAGGHEGVPGDPAAVPALGKSLSHLGWLGPLPTSAVQSLPRASGQGLSLACREDKHSWAGSALGQDVRHIWDPSANPHHAPTPWCLLTFSFPLAKRSVGAVGHWQVQPSGCLTLLCPREQWRAAAWASPSSVPPC